MLRFFLSVLTLTYSLVANGQALNLDKVIAIVNEEAITLSEYQVRYKRGQLMTTNANDLVPAKLDVDVLRTLIDERLQAQMAISRGISVTELEVEQTLNEMAVQNELPLDQLISELDAQGISPMNFRRGIVEQRLIQKLIDVAVNSRITISDEEIDYHLQAHKELYTPNEAYEISHLYISTDEKSDEEIQQIAAKIKTVKEFWSTSGEFSEVIKTYSEGGDVEGEGYLGWRKEDQLPELFLNALRQTSVGAISEVLQSANGFHLLKVHSKEGDLKIVTQQLIRHILIQPARNDLTENEMISLAEDLRRQLIDGADFSKIARLHSDDNESAEEGGSLGWVNPGDAVPELEEAASALALNTLSQPVRSRFGYHLIEVQDRRKKDITYDLARKKAENEIFRRKAKELYEIWFDRLKNGAYIEFVAVDQ